MTAITNTRLTLSEQLETLLPEIQENARQRGAQLEREAVKEQIDHAIDNGDTNSAINGIVRFTDRFIFQPGTTLERHQEYFLWAMTNNLYNQIKRIESNRARNTDTDPMNNRTPETLKALREYFNAYKSSYEKTTNKSWKPQKKWIDNIIEAKNEDGTTTTKRYRILSPEKKLLILTGPTLDTDDAKQLMNSVKEKNQDFLLIRTNNSEADTALADWFKENIDNATAKEMIIAYDFSQRGDPITPVFDQLLAANPDEVLILERSVLNNDFIEHAAERGIDLNVSYPVLSEQITQKTRETDITQ